MDSSIFAERRNLVSARVPSHFKCSVQILYESAVVLRCKCITCNVTVCLGQSRILLASNRGSYLLAVTWFRIAVTGKHKPANDPPPHFIWGWEQNNFSEHSSLEYSRMLEFWKLREAKFRTVWNWKIPSALRVSLNLVERKVAVNSTNKTGNVRIAYYRCAFA